MVFDPRVGLALLVFANLAAFSEQPFWMEMTWIGFLLLLMLLHHCCAPFPFAYWSMTLEAATTASSIFV